MLNIECCATNQLQTLQKSQPSLILDISKCHSAEQAASQPNGVGLAMQKKAGAYPEAWGLQPVEDGHLMFHQPHPSCASTPRHDVLLEAPHQAPPRYQRHPWSWVDALADLLLQHELPLWWSACRSLPGQPTILCMPMPKVEGLDIIVIMSLYHL